MSEVTLMKLRRTAKISNSNSVADSRIHDNFFVANKLFRSIFARPQRFPSSKHSLFILHDNYSVVIMVSITSPGGAMAPPPIPTPLKTPLKRPTLALKRDNSYMDTDDETGLSSSTKKLRVAFDPNVDVRIMEDWTEKSFDLVKEEVTQGIDRHIAPGDQRDDVQYVKLLQLLGHDAFSGEALNSKLLKKYVLAIDSKVSVLGECGKLVIAVLDLSWLGRDGTFITLFTKFLCDLASAHAKFIPAMMERLVPHFPKLPASLGRLPEETSVSRTEMFARLHLVIKAVLRQIPSASSTLMRVLRVEFPNDLATTKSYLQ